MPYLNCARCGLTINLRAMFLAIENCPRCRVRRGVLSRLELSQAPTRRTGAGAPNRPPAADAESGSEQ